MQDAFSPDGLSFGRWEGEVLALHHVVFILTGKSENGSPFSKFHARKPAPFFPLLPTPRETITSQMNEWKVRSTAKRSNLGPWLSPGICPRLPRTLPGLILPSLLLGWLSLALRWRLSNPFPFHEGRPIAIALSSGTEDSWVCLFSSPKITGVSAFVRACFCMCARMCACTSMREYPQGMIAHVCAYVCVCTLFLTEGVSVCSSVLVSVCACLVFLRFFSSS